jgi:hypothetical protein
MTPRTKANWDDQSEVAEEAWYDDSTVDESGVSAVDDTADPNARFGAAGAADARKFAAREAELLRKAAANQQQHQQRITARQQARNEAANRWEEEQLMKSGRSDLFRLCVVVLHFDT